MDGEEVELSIRVEAALEDQGRAFRHPWGGRRACAPGAHASARFCHPWHDVEMRIEPDRISNVPAVRRKAGAGNANAFAVEEPPCPCCREAERGTGGGYESLVASSDRAP